MTAQPVGGMKAPSLLETKCRTLQRLLDEIRELERHLGIEQETLAKARAS
jgi:hypothetical protein